MGGTVEGPRQGWDRDPPAPRLTPPLTCPRYHLAVTRRHENEPSSSSIYTQNDPWDPPVTFESFIRDNETIEDQVTPGTRGDSGHTGPVAAEGPGAFPSPEGGPSLGVPQLQRVSPAPTGFPKARGAPVPEGIPISHWSPQHPWGGPWCH